MLDGIQKRLGCLACLAGIALLTAPALSESPLSASPSGAHSELVGTQYDTTHVYVARSQIDALVASFIATFGGHATPRIVTNVLPVPSSTESQAVLTPAGNLSVFAFRTPVPFPFGLERNGYLVTDIDRALNAAKAAGADVVVAPFNDPIGRDTVIEWPGGVKMQLYWHTTAPVYAPLQSVPESRVYVSPDRADEFVRDIEKFGRGKVISDDKQADAGQIGRPGESFRLVRVMSDLGETAVFVTDGHLPYPFGLERTGYQVANLSDSLTKATASGALVLFPAYDAGDRYSAIVDFPGGYIAEIHALKSK